MNPAEKKAFQRMFATLGKNLDPDPVAAELYSAGVLTDNQHSEILAEKTKTQKNSAFLRYVRDNGRGDIFPTFVKCIKDADKALEYLADQLQEQLDSGSGSGTVHDPGRLLPSTSMSPDTDLGGMIKPVQVEGHQPSAQEGTAQLLSSDQSMLGSEETDGPQIPDIHSVETMLPKQVANTQPDVLIPSSLSNEPNLESSELTDGPTEDMDVIPKHPLPPVEKFKISEKFMLRNYQKELAQVGLQGQNCIIVAPTGSGKTLISAKIISDHLIRTPEGRGKVVFVVSRVPLTHQQVRHLRSYMPHVHVEAVYGGSVGALHVMLKEADIVVCTHGILAKAFREKTVALSDISLLVLDECHNLRGYSIYAQLMHVYLLDKRDGKAVPQAIGLTATPGAGKGSRIVMNEVREHLLDLCAVMDAPQGYCIVVKNREELARTVFSASIEVLQTSTRNRNDTFFEVANTFMKRLEDQLLVDNPHPRNEFSYVAWAQQLQSRVSTLDIPREEHQRKMLSLEYLVAYANALCVYEDLDASFALEILQECTAELKNSKLEHGQKLFQLHSDVKENLQECTKHRSTESEHLKQLMRILQCSFDQNPESRAIVFTRTKYHAKCINKWIRSNKHESIRCDTCTGHNKTSAVVGMNDYQQQEVLKKFEEGKVNVLVATSVLEEGLDVANCNLVIRFLYVTDEVSLKQTGGRGRSEGSQHVSLVPLASKSHQRELINSFKDRLVEEALRVMKGEGADLNIEVVARQRRILAELEQKRRAITERPYPSEDVQLLCKGCREPVCRGSDLRIVHETHFTLSHMGFIERKVTFTKHSEAGTELHDAGGLTKNQHISCKRCGHHKWGITCDFQRPDIPDLELPVLKCKQFIFRYSQLHIGREDDTTHMKWGKRKFDVRPYLDVDTVDSDDEGIAL